MPKMVEIRLTAEQDRALYGALIAAHSYNRKAIEDFKDDLRQLAQLQKDLADVEALIHLADRAWQPADAPSTN